MTSKLNKDKKIDLYIASNIDGLDKYVDNADQNLAKKSGKMLLSAAEKLYKGAEENRMKGDEEKAYILYMRYCMLVLTKIKKSVEYKKDPDYFNNMLGKKPEFSMGHAEKLKSSLKERYEYIEAQKASEKLEASRSQDKTDSNLSNSKRFSGFIKPIDLYTVSKTQKILLIDIRDSEDYRDSRVKLSTLQLIHVADDILESGIIVSHIETSLTSADREIFKKRSSFDYIVLMDMDSIFSQISLKHPLQIIKDAIYRWDSKSLVKIEPLILEGGFLSWSKHYPTLVDRQSLVDHVQSISESPAVKSVPSNSTPSPDLTTKVTDDIRSTNVDAKAKDTTKHETVDEKVQPEETQSDKLYPKLIMKTQPKTPTQQTNKKVDRSTTGSSNEDAKNKFNSDSVSKPDKSKANRNQIEPGDTKTTPVVRRNLKPKEQFPEGSSAVVPPDTSSPILKRAESNEIEIPDNFSNTKFSFEEMKRDSPETTSKNLLIPSRDLKPTKKSHEETKPTVILNDTDRLNVDESSAVANDAPNLTSKQSVSKSETYIKTDQSLLDTNAQELGKQQPASKKESAIAEQNLDQKKEQKIPHPSTNSQSRSSQPSSSPMSRIPKPDDSTQRPSVQLPDGWTRQLDPRTGRYFFVDHNTKSTHWNLPSSMNVKRVPSKSAEKQFVPLKDDADKPGASKLRKSHSFSNLSKIPKTPSSSIPVPTTPKVDRSVKPSVRFDFDVRPKNVNIAKQRSFELFAARRRDFEPSSSGFSGFYGATGLRNLGNTCYMNSIIQCLSNSVALRNFLLSGKHKQDLNLDNPYGTDGRVAEEFAQLLRALWSGQFRNLSPVEFKRIIGNQGDKWAGFQQQDSHEFLGLIMDTLHEDLNKGNPRDTVKEREEDYESLPDNEFAKASWNLHRKIHNSIIVDLFQGQFKSVTRCASCSYHSTKFDAFMYITLELPAGKHRCTLEECFALFLKEECITDWRCPKCKRTPGYKRMSIWRLPRILVIPLKRFLYGYYGEKNSMLVDFPIEKVDLTSLQSCNPAQKYIYQLYATSNHFGTLDGGHYTAICKNTDVQPQRWFKYDDNEVTFLNSTSVLRDSSAYVLFYSLL